ncbi:MAG: hypothetical protein FJ149_12045 [Euryarchaeota archaeon]|nr:hypothetical protein [Euryarchaeota archaeon]
MATSIKIRERDKRRLDRLQGELTVRHGRKVSQQELLSLLLNLADKEKRRLLADATRPMSKREIASLKRLCVDTGVETREEEIDRVLTEAEG